MQSIKPIIAAIAVVAPLVVAACSGDRGFSSPFATQAAPPPAPAKPAPPPVEMSGRWILSSPAGGQCGVTFTAAPGATSGKVAPEGGCPGRFFTSRQWAFEQGALVIYDHKEQALARLAMSEPPGGFAGTAVSGIPVNLSR